MCARLHLHPKPIPIPLCNPKHAKIHMLLSHAGNKTSNTKKALSVYSSSKDAVRTETASLGSGGTSAPCPDPQKLSVLLVIHFPARVNPLSYCRSREHPPSHPSIHPSIHPCNQPAMQPTNQTTKQVLSRNGYLRVQNMLHTHRPRPAEPLARRC